LQGRGGCYERTGQETVRGKVQGEGSEYKEALAKWKESNKIDDGDEEGYEEEEDGEASSNGVDKSPPKAEKSAAPKKRGKAEDATSSPPEKKAKGKGRGRGRGAAADKETASAMSEKPDATASPPQKKGRGRGRGACAELANDEKELDSAVLEKARGLGMEAALKNLANRDGMSGVPADKLLAALGQSGGLVNKARAAVLGA